MPCSCFFTIIYRMRKILAFLALGALLVGCHTYDIVQSNVFSDDDGNVVVIDYGRSEKPHVNTFVSPANGETLEFKSTLVVAVTLPDGKHLTAWQCMNFQHSGTMYKTDDEKWLVHVNGFSAMLYQQTAENKDRYLEVYRGILCDSPEVDYEPNKKWRNMKKDAKGKWH